MAIVSHFEQVVLCDTQAEYDATLLDLENYIPQGISVPIVTINQFSSETPKRIVAVYDDQSVVV